MDGRFTDEELVIAKSVDKIIVGSKEEYDRILANKKTVLDYNEVE